MSKDYTFQDGAYRFVDEDVVLELRNVQQDRSGRILADARVTTIVEEKMAILAMDHGDITSGRWRSDFASQVAKRNSGDTIRFENLVMEAMFALQTDPDLSPAATKPELLPAPEFIKTVAPPGPTVVEGLLERGCVYGFVSKPKTGKSLLALSLAVAITEGCLWLGRKVASGMVAFFQLEDSERTIKRRLERIASQPLSNDLLIHARVPFRLTEENFALTVTACQGCAMVVVDPIIQVSEVKDWNAQGEVRAAYDRWRRLARDTDATVLVLAHHRKMAGDHGDQIAGSIQAQATLDGMLEIRRDTSLLSNQRRLSFIGRDWEDMEDEVIELDPDNLIFNVVGAYGPVSEEVAKQRKEPDLRALLEVLPEAPPGLTYKELEERTGWERRVISKLIKMLGDEVGREGKSQSKKDPLRLFRSTHDEEDGTVDDTPDTQQLI